MSQSPAHEIPTYEIHLRGRLDRTWEERLGLEMARAGDRTVLLGALDQSALHRVLRQLADLGLVVDSARRLP